MKKTILSLLLLIAAYACSNSPEKEAQKRIEQHIQENAHDAKSYEFISIEKIETFTKLDSLNKLLSIDSMNISIYTNFIKDYKERVETYSEKVKDRIVGFIYEEDLKQSVESLKGFEETLAKVEADKNTHTEAQLQLQNNPNTNIVLHEAYKLDFRIKNLMGAYYKTHATIKHYPQSNQWGDIEFAPSPIEEALQN